jgi:type I restriction enzyme S subunit
MTCRSKNWPWIRSRFLFTRVDIRGVPAPLASATKEGVSLRKDLDYSVWNPTTGIDGYKLVEPDDFVIGLRSFQHGISHSSIRGLVSPAYTVIRPSGNICPRYYKYYFRSNILISSLSSITQGIRQGQAIDIDAFFNLRFPVPPLEEQRMIADFLDNQINSIDRAASKLHEEISLVASREASVLNRHTAYENKPLIRVKFLINRLTSGPRGWGDFISEQGSPFIRITNIPRRGIKLDLSDLVYVNAPVGPERERTRTQVGDILVSITADVGSVALVSQDAINGNVSQHIALLRPEVSVCEARWLAYALKSPRVKQQLDMNSYGGTKVGVGLSEIANLTVPKIPLDKQREAASRIDAEFEWCASLTASLLQKAALLEEKKRALITAAVTGEFDIFSASGRK